ncbi:MAG TPA: PCRF domain-containing protein, partial [Myxococcota bacterium]|nr:PCRF domain-containing protein [Myxococcota bacterium]
MFVRLEELQRRLEELDRLLMDPSISSNLGRMRDVSREHSDLTKMVDLAHRIQQTEKELAQLSELAADPDMREMVEDERAELQARLPELEKQLTLLMLPKDPYEGRNLMLEIRAGTGGDEAAIFAADLFRMYSRYALQKGWKIELLNTSESGTGGDAAGMKEITAL